MENRKKLVLCLGFTLLSFISFYIYKEQSHYTKGQEILLDCFKSSRASLEESVLSGWISLDIAFTEEDLSEKIDLLMDGLSIDKSKAKKTIETGGDSNKGMLTADKESSSYTMILESMKNDDGSIESYCMFRSSSANNFEGIIKEKQLIEKVLKEISLPVKLDVMITGSYKGKMSQNQTNATISKLLRNLRASKVESIERDDIISISAYSVEIGEHIISNGMKINVQIALRYSNYNNRTYIWLGSPIIPFEY